MATYKENLTKGFIDKISAPKANGSKSAFDSYYDTKERGLVLLVTSNGVKTFYLLTKIQGRTLRIKIGRFPELTVTNAREVAQTYKAQLAKGEDPEVKKKQLKAELTLGELFKMFMERYSKPQKQSWKEDERTINKYYHHWFNRKLSAISKYDVSLYHNQLRAKRGIYVANRMLERLKAMYNKAIEWGWNGENPAIGIKMFKETKRERFILPHEFQSFFAAVEAEPDPHIRAFFLLLLYTGARRSNVLAMRWDQIDWQLKFWRIPLTKSGEPQTIPLTDVAIKVLKALKEADNNASPWVFPSATSASGHFMDPKKAWQRLLKKANLQNLRIHDLRRTLGSYMTMNNTSLHIVGKALGHHSSDATEVYARLQVETIRQASQGAINLMHKNC